MRLIFWNCRYRIIFLLSNYLNPYSLPRKCNELIEERITAKVKNAVLAKRLNLNSDTSRIENEIEQLVYRWYVWLN